MSDIESNCGEFVAVKTLEFERFKNKAGSNYIVLSPQRWIEARRVDKRSASTNRLAA